MATRRHWGKVSEGQCEDGLGGRSKGGKGSEETRPAHSKWAHSIRLRILVLGGVWAPAVSVFPDAVSESVKGSRRRQS